MSLFSDKFIDFVVQISDSEFSQTRVLNLRNFPGYLLNNLMSPFLSFLETVAFCCKIGSFFLRKRVK